MKAVYLSLVFVSLLAVSCSPRVTSHLITTYEPLPETESVAVLPLGSAVPETAESLGEVAVNDSGFTTRKNGTYAAVIDLAKQEARKAGGNVLLLTDHRLPDFVSTIHRIRADVYRVDPAENDLTVLAAPVTYAAAADSLAVGEDVPAEIIRPKPPKAFMLGMWGGGGYRTSRTDPQLTGIDRDYVNAMKWGLSFGADALYYFGTWGLGMRYSSLRGHHNGRATFTTEGGKAQTGDVDQHSNIWFLGPTLALRDTFGEKGNSFYVIYGLGYMGYKLESEIPSYYPQTATGGTAGYFFDLGMDFRLTERAYFSVALSYYSGALSRYNLKNGNMTQEIELEDEQREGLNYLALNFGLHWYLGRK